MPSVPRTRGLTEEFAYGYGWQEVVAVANPAAGQELTYSIAGQYDSRLLACEVLLTTSAAVASRYLTLQYLGGDGVPFAVNGAAVLVTASSTAQYSFSHARGTAEWNTGTGVFVPLLPQFLEPGESIKIDVDSIQAGDTLTNIRLVLERFPTGGRGYPEGAVQVPVGRRRR